MPDTPKVQRTIEEDLFAKLNEWRREKAAMLNVAPFVVLHDSALVRIVERRPRDLIELSEIKGIGTINLAQYGPEILNLLHEIKKAHLPPDLRLQIEVWRQGGEEPDLALLLDALRRPDQIEHADLMLAIDALGELGIRQAADELIDLLRQTTNGNLLMTLGEAMGRLNISSAEAELIRLLDDIRPGVRRAAARSLGRLRSSNAQEKLEMMAQSDPTDSVRLATAAAAWLIKHASREAP